MKKTLCLLLCATLFATILSAQTFRVGSYNIRYANQGDSLKGNSWTQRYPAIVDMIRFHGFDIFGTQEGLIRQLSDLQRNLPGYAYIGVGRDDGKQAGEHSAIFYRTDMFEVLESGNFWLSEITDRPNKGWDAALPRICSWGKFRVKNTRVQFYMFNLHMDHVGVKARAESAKLILKKISEFPKDIPVILSGDFNVDQYNESYTLINNSGQLRDSYELAPIKLATNGTFNNWDSNGFSDSRIDHIFLSPQLTVNRYGILTDSYREKLTGEKTTYANRLPSDHFPVLIEVSYKR